MKGEGKRKGKAGSDEDAGSVMFSGNMQKFLALCRKHNRMEYGDMPHQLLMQLGCGLFTYQEWAYVNSKLVDEISGDGVAVSGHSFQGSHTCHNGCSDNVHCRNPFCMVWESTVDNGFRKVCQNNFLDASCNNDLCTCGPSLSFPCVNRTQQTHDVIRTTFLDPFNSLRQKRNVTNDTLVYPFGRYPFPDFRQEKVIVSKLSDCFDGTIHPLMKHMNISHGMNMRLS
jgi:hypothetical protein